MFSKDGRIVLEQRNQIRFWQVDPALECTTLRYASNRTLNHARPSIHREGRILAVGTDHGVILWDLAHKAELGFLPIGMAWHSAFEPVSGDLLTNGGAGVLRWPVQRDPSSGEVRIGPPRNLPLQGSRCSISFDRTGQTVVVAGVREAQVALDDQRIVIGPLDDCRGVSLSPDGKWLVTNSHTRADMTIWRLPDRVSVTNLPGEAFFSSDGRWLANESSGSTRLLEVGTWREVLRFDGALRDFSPDVRLAILQDTSEILRLVEIETGRVLARIERPDLQHLGWLKFSPDGSRLVGTTNEPPSAQVIDLRLLRRQLGPMGLDWHAPAFSDDDPARPDLPPFPPLRIDYGFLAGHLAHVAESSELLVKRYTERIKKNPDDFDAYHHRAHALVSLKRREEAIADLSRSILLSPDDAHLFHFRGQLFYLADPKKPERALPDLERALRLDPSRSSARELLSTCYNNLAWDLAKNKPSSSDLERALRLSARSVELAPGKQVSLNTRGVVLYRSGQFAEAVTNLEKSLEAGHGQFDAFDFYFLAMSHHRMGHRDEARRCFDRATEWVRLQASLPNEHAAELAAFRSEAETILSGPVGELPEDVFEQPKLTRSS
jgi:tetratricopeptide (TPR) repeat protein/WD40 repeat protein